MIEHPIYVVADFECIVEHLPSPSKDQTLSNIEPVSFIKL